MTQMEKMQLRVLKIIEDSRVAWGNLASEINTPANMIRLFKNNLNQCSIVLGQLFIPALKKVLPYINAVTIALKNLLTEMAVFMGVELTSDDFGNGFIKLEEEVSEVEDGLDGALNSTKELKKQLQGFDKLNVISSSTADGNIGIQDSIDLTNEIIKATEEYQKVWEKAYGEMEAKAQALATRIEEIFSGVKNFFESIGKGDWFNVGKNFNELPRAITELIATNLAKIDWVKAGGAIAKFVQGFDDSGLFESIGSLVYRVLVSIGQAAYGYLEQYGGNIIWALGDAIFKSTSGLGLKMSANITKGFAGSFLEDIAKIFENTITTVNEKLINPLRKAFKDVSDYIKGIFEGALLVVKAVWKVASDWFDEKVIQPIIKAFEPLGNKISEKLQPFKDFWIRLTKDIQILFNTLSNGIGNAIVNAINGAIGKAEKGINGMVNGLNELIGGFNKVVQWAADVLGENWNGISLLKSVSFNRIPAYAMGGFPEDGWFRASKGEYFGSFDDGTSVIANNNQIISGIANGVRSANSEQNALLREQNALLRQILAKDTGISSRAVFDAVRTEDRNYSLRNGQSAFVY